MPTHEVEGAILHYEKFGSGPLLVLIPGADGRGEIFHDAARILANKYTVICLTRRGYSKSLLIGAQDFSNRLSTDADDAHLVITDLGSPAFVFGTSSGAVVATRLLERYPESVQAVVAYEAPSFSVLPEEHRLKATGLLTHIYDIYRANGVQTAIEAFTNGLAESSDKLVMRHCMDINRGDEIRANAMFWFEFELRQYTTAPVNLELIAKEKKKYIPAAGVVSADGAGTGPTAVIAGVLGKEIVRFPGGHLSYMTDVEGFAEALKNTLEGI